MKPIIHTDKLEVTYNAGKANEFRALRGITIDIYPGEYIILFGPSGCGKSTLLYSILGTLPPTGGKMYVKGEDVYAYNPKEMVNYQRNVVGIIYQAFNLIPSLSVVDNVSLPQIFAGIDPEARKRRAVELLKRFGVAHIADKLTTNLSGGQMQRVAVSRSLVNDPEILLGDEPVGNLDSLSATQVMNTLEEVNLNDKKTVILVTHDAKYLPYAHRVYYLNDGNVVRDVPNPEKKQIKKSEGHAVVTEIERLAKLYPYATIEELRVRSAVNYLTQDMDFQELAIFEKAIDSVIKGNMGRHEMYEILYKKISEGGVGLSKERSRKLSEQMEILMKQAADVTRFRRGLVSEEMSFEEEKYIKRIKEYLLEDYKGKISKEKDRNLEEAIKARISGDIRSDEFKMLLETSVKKGGVGLSAKAALKLSRHLEKLLAQGIEYAKKGEEYIGSETKQT